MNNKNYNIVIDFGSSKIRAAAIEKDDAENNFYYESAYLFDQDNVEIEIKKIISKIEENTNEYLNSINLMIDNPKTKSIGLSLSKSFGGLKLKKKDIQFLIQDAKQQILRNYSDQTIVHIIIKNYKIDNINYAYLPTDVMCNLISVDIIFICMPKKDVENLKKIFFNFDISINQIFCSSYAKSLSYKKNFSSNENILFIDMGFNKTSMIYYNKSQFSFFHTISVGGNHITKDLSKILNVDLKSAEEIKLFFDKDSHILNKKKISLELTQKIIFARIEEILELCVKFMKFNENQKKTNEYKIILMGDGSKILDNKFKEKISFSKEIDLLEETVQGICESLLRLSNEPNKQEVVMVAKKQIKEGFFEKLFHFFR